MSGECLVVIHISRAAALLWLGSVLRVCIMELLCMAFD